MLIQSPKSLQYPVTVTELLKQTNDTVERFAPLFSYYYETTVTESNKYGEEKQVKKKIPLRFESVTDGTITGWRIAVGAVIKGAGEPLVDIEEPCLHEVQFGGMCANCGRDMTAINRATQARETERAPINMAHGNTALKISEKEAQRLDEEAKRRLLANKRLSLVVDLDQTIIQATVDPTVAEWQKDEGNPNHDAVKDVRAFQLTDEGPGGRGCWYYVKLRPGLENFLENIAKLYELHVYTMGTRAYARNIAKIVDPDQKIFGDRILSRDESGSMSVKKLARLFPVDTRMVVIIDDRGDVWKWSPNLVKVSPYNFFVGIGDINSSFLPRRTELIGSSVEAMAPEQTANGATAEGENKANPPEDYTEAGTAAPHESTPPKEQNGEVSTLEQQLVAMTGGDNPQLLEQQTSKQDETIAAQVADRPLLQKQKMLDEADEAAAKEEAKEVREDSSVPHSPRQRHNLLQDNDIELQRLEASLRRVHQAFFDEYDRRLAGSHGGRVAQLRGEKGSKKRPIDDLQIVPDVAEVMPKLKREVLGDTVIVFSGVIPRQVDVQSSDIAQYAKSFGARVEERITKRTTHVVAARKGTDKVNKAARRPDIKIVTIQWLVESLAQWKQVDEKPYLLDVDRSQQSGVPSDDPENGVGASSSEDDRAITGDELEDAYGDEDGDGAETDDTDAPAELTAPLQPLSPEDEKAMYDDLKEFLGSDDESDTESDGSDSSIPSTNSTPGKRKRKRNTDSANSTDAEDSDASVTDGVGSMLQRRKKQAMERTTSLTNVTSAEKSSGLPSPDATGPEEGQEAVREPVEGNESDDFDDAALEAEMMAELEKESDIDDA